VQNTSQRQALTEIRVYPGGNASFTLYDDDGVTNAYTSGGGRSAQLRWDESAKRLSTSGKLPTGQDASALLKLAGP
jgi:alpha-D-xyloside xylohydrolase